MRTALAIAVLAFAGVARADFRVDSTAVAADYQNADFERIEAALRPILTPGTACERQDSLLAFKYLSVVYAAHPKTREKGRYCMLRLLDLDPAADLIDLFVGEEVDDLFVRARREHEMTRYAAEEKKPSADSVTALAPGSRSRQWLVSAVAAAAVAGIAWYSWENSPAHEKTATPSP